MTSVLIPLAQGCEELEAITLTDLFTRAGFEVTTASLTAAPVKASRGATLIADTELEDVTNDEFDLIALPGGLPGADNLAANATLQQMILKQHDRQGWLAAICAAPKVLAKAGLLAGRTITSYPGALDALSGNWQNTGAAIERDGHIITGRGPGVSLDFALFLIELLGGMALRRQVEQPLVR